MAQHCVNPKLVAGVMFAGAACCSFLPLTGFLVLAGAGALYLDASR